MGRAEYRNVFRRGQRKAVAASVVDRVLTFLGFEEVEEEVADGEDSMSAHEVADKAPPLRGRKRSPRPRHSAAEERAPQVEREQRSNVVRSGNVARLIPSFPGMVVASPKRFEDAQEVADNLRAGKPVILQVEGMDGEIAKKIVHFLMGAVYALGGELHRIGAVVLFVPAGVEVTLPLSLRMAEREVPPHA